MGITVGMKGVAETLCEREDTAKEVGSGDLLVYATPCMVALMEGAACEAVAEGLEVRAEAEVTAVAGKVITFAVRAFDEAGEIGHGTHQRVVVSNQKFLDKAYSKL